jgi:hypothetical protein
MCVTLAVCAPCRSVREVEQASGVAIGETDQARARVVVETQPGQRLPAGAFEELAHLVGRERLQHVHRSAREQRRVDLEGRVFGRRADKGQQPAFDIGQESVLLRLVEAMHFIDEENRPPATAGARHFGTCHRLTDVLDA